MVIDTSAAFAILAGEADGANLAARIAEDELPKMSTFSVLELRVAIARRFGLPDAARVDAFLRHGDVRIVPFDDQLASMASAAYMRFGKGLHPARLNLGDCVSYALAQSLDEPLLYKGNDFSKTDVRSALAEGVE